MRPERDVIVEVGPGARTDLVDGERLAEAVAEVARASEPRSVTVGDVTVLAVPRDAAPAKGDSICLLDPAGQVQSWSAGAPPAILDGLRAARVLAAGAAGGILEEHGWRTRKDGSRFWADVLVAALRDSSGKLRGYVEITRDLTERRAAEEERLESERRFRTMADCAPVMLWMSGKDAECHFFNRGWLEFTGRAMAQEVGVGWAESVLAEDFPRCMDVYLESFVERRSFRMEYRMRRHDGQYRWILDQGVPLFAPGGAFEGYIGSCVDVTELREAREAADQAAAELERRVQARTAELSAALAEREVLLREIHHRVKNNLQLISSLFSLQARRVEPAARAQLEDAQSRVRSIALIHEKLYGARNLSAVSFGRYVSELVDAVRQVSGERPVEMTVEAEDVELAIDVAIPCGLIVNELATNALKHAFPAGRAGRVRIAVARAGEGGIRLTVADDGVGLAPGIDVGRSATLGLELVHTLARQIGASLEVDRRGGTTFCLTLRGT